MRVFEETIPEKRKSDLRVLVEVNTKEGKLLLEICEKAIKAHPKKSSYKTMLKKLEEMPCFFMSDFGRNKIK